MKYVKLFVIFLFFGFVMIFYNCNDRPKEKTENKKKYAKNQQYLFDLLDNYKSEYFATKRQDIKSTIQSKYLEKLRYFLVDSLGRYLDSMNVTVDTIIQRGWLITTQFHSRDIQFKYAMKFKDGMDSRNDSLYRWMRSFKSKKDLTLNFLLLGSAQLNYADDSTKNILNLFAVPELLSGRPKK